MYVRIACYLAVTATLGWVQPGRAQIQEQIAALTTHESDIALRLVGFGIVYGLEGTGDRNLGSLTQGGSPSARAIANILRRFDIAVPAEILRPRNVAAVLVEGEVSPYLRPGGKFDLHVSSIQDATSLRGGRLLMMPFVTDPGQPPVAVGAGGVLVTNDPASRITGRGGTAGRVPDGGVLEVEIPRPQPSATPSLNLKRPNVLVANQIAEVINGALGDGVASAVDPGTVQLNPPAQYADNLNGFYAEIDTLTVGTMRSPKIIISRHDGTVATVGNVVVGQATVSHNGITLSVGGDQGSPPIDGMIRAQIGVSIHDIAAGLHAAGAKPQELATIFSMLRRAGALSAEVEIQ